MPTEDGTYFLQNNVALTEPYVVEAGKNITICLNGHSVLPDFYYAYEDNFKDMPLIINRGTLRFDDCKHEEITTGNDNRHYFYVDDSGY